MCFYPADCANCCIERISLWKTFYTKKCRYLDRYTQNRQIYIYRLIYDSYLVEHFFLLKTKCTEKNLILHLLNNLTVLQEFVIPLSRQSGAPPPQCLIPWGQAQQDPHQDQPLHLTIISGVRQSKFYNHFDIDKFKTDFQNCSKLLNTILKCRVSEPEAEANYNNQRLLNPETPCRYTYYCSS